MKETEALYILETTKAGGDVGGQEKLWDQESPPESGWTVYSRLTLYAASEEADGGQGRIYLET